MNENFKKFENQIRNVATGQCDKIMNQKFHKFDVFIKAFSKLFNDDHIIDKI